MSSLVVIGLTILFLIISIVFLSLKKDTEKYIRKAFSLVLAFILVWEIGIILRFTIGTYSDTYLFLCDIIVYIGACFVSVFMLELSLAFVSSKTKYTKKDLLLFIVPICTIIMICTNKYHNLFYTYYSKNLITFGPYMAYVHSIYTYGLLFLSMILLLRYSVKNSGFFSKASVSISFAIIIPVILSVLVDNTTELYYYIIPSSLFLSTMLLMLALLRFKLLNIAPIALQRIVDRMSDGYVVLNSKMKISDHNQTLINIFSLGSAVIRGIPIELFFGKHLKDTEDHINQLTSSIASIESSTKTIEYDTYIQSVGKYFHIEINKIFSGSNILGILILFKDITQHKLDMETIKNNQDILMEKERLASLGQMIGGIAHNLKTPILSIAGTSEALIDLINEYDNSVEDTKVTVQDHHEIAKEMLGWISKTKSYTAYMSDVITAVKGQAVAFSNEDIVIFTMDELVKTVDILMKHE